MYCYTKAGISARSVLAGFGACARRPVLATFLLANKLHALAPEISQLHVLDSWTLYTAYEQYDFKAACMSSGAHKYENKQ